MLTERFGFCLTLPLDDGLEVTELLRKSGYRPTRFRPYADGPLARVATLWTRDTRRWQLKSGLRLEDVAPEDEKCRTLNLVPVDVAGYGSSVPGGKVSEKYAVVWVERPEADLSGGEVSEKYAAWWAKRSKTSRTQLFVGLGRKETSSIFISAPDAIPETLQAVRSSDGRIRYASIWRMMKEDRSPGNNSGGTVGLSDVESEENRADSDVISFDRLQVEFGAAPAPGTNHPPIDISVHEPSRIPPRAEREAEQHRRARRTIEMGVTTGSGSPFDCAGGDSSMV